MYIKSLQLVSFKSFEAATLELSKSVNVLVGKNNSGKSSVIRAVYQIQSSNAVSLSDIRKGSEQSVLLIGVAGISNEQYRTFSKDDYQPVSSIIIRKILRSSSDGSQVYTMFYPSEFIDNITLKGEVIPKQEHTKVFPSRTFAGLQSNELKHAFIYPFFSRRKSNVGAYQLVPDENHTISEEYKFILSKVKRLTNTSHPKSKEFIYWCKEIIHTEVGMIQQQGGEQIGIFITDGEPIVLNQMGDGIMHVVGLLALLLSDEGKLYIIEEIENDLHPEALKLLLQFILSKTDSNQFIISTHSNIVLKYLGTAEHCKIFETDMKFQAMNDSNNVKIPVSTIREVPNNPTERLAILQKLGYDAFDFEIYDGYLLLEESSAERIIKEFLIPWFVPGLSGRLQTIAATGVSTLGPWLQDMLRLFVYTNNSPFYRNKAWIIADGDPDGLASINSLKDKFKQVPPEHFDNFSFNAFESCYPPDFNSYVEEINATPDKKKKRQLKAALIEKVVVWCYTNHKEAKAAFKESAAEIVLKLELIEAQLNSKR